MLCKVGHRVIWVEGDRFRFVDLINDTEPGKVTWFNLATLGSQKVSKYERT